MRMNSMGEFARIAGWLASVAYAAGCKRVARTYLLDMLLALTHAGNGVVIMSGALPGSAPYRRR